jgi:MFS family permease
MFYAQGVRGWTPTESALLMAPMAVLTGVLAPMVGRLVDRTHPRYIAGTGFALLAVALAWLAALMTPDSPVWQLLLPIALMGAAMAGIWSPLAATATHGLPPHQAGAGSGVYNTTRQVGAVLGSAAVGALITSRLAVHGLTGGGTADAAEGGTTALPEPVRAPFAAAMAESTLLPAAVLLVGFAAALFFGRPGRAEPVPSLSLEERSTLA